MKKFIGLLLMVALSGVVAHAQEGEKKRKVPFQTKAVTRGSVFETVQATGTLQPEEVFDIGAQVAGRIEKLGTDADGKAIDYNSRVEVGTVLAQIDSRLFQAEVDNAKAAVRLAQANLQVQKAQLVLAKRDKDRGLVLQQRKAISQEDFDRTIGAYELAEARLEVHKATLQQTEAALKVAQTNLEYTSIRSPIAGVIIDRRVNVGQTVVAGLTAPSLFLIAKDLKRLQVWVQVHEADISRIHKGQRATFQVDARPGLNFKGTVSQIRKNASLTQNIVTFVVVIDTDNSAGKLLPYLTAEVSLPSERKNVLLVPNACLRWRPSPEQVAPIFQNDIGKIGIVWVPDKGRVRPVRLQLGLTDGKVTEILEGDLAEGDAVIVGNPEPKIKQPRDADLLIVPRNKLSRMPLTILDVEAIKRNCPAVAEAAPIVRLRTRVAHGGHRWVPLYIYGSTPAFLNVKNWEEMKEGQSFTEFDVRARKKVCLVGETIVKELFAGKSPLGKEIRVGDELLKIVGVLRHSGENGWGLDQDDIILAPWTTISDLRSKANQIDQTNAIYPGWPSTTRAGPTLISNAVEMVLVRATSPKEVGEAERQIAALLRNRHHIRMNRQDAFDIGSDLMSPRP
jgi:HlyD family secretion protein